MTARAPVLTAVAVALVTFAGACTPPAPAAAGEGEPAPAAASVADERVFSLIASADLARDGSCQAEQSEPCLGEPRQVPPCGDELPATVLSLEDALEQRNTLLGQSIGVRHRLSLSPVACTELACDRQCCNSCGANLTFRLDAPSGGYAELVLGGDGTGHISDHLACTGDESLMCCATAVPDAEVVAMGTLRNANAEFYLEGTWLCVP